MDYEYYMHLAIEQARLAFQIDEVPIGCVIVKDNEVLSTGYNMRKTQNNVLYHAEIIAIDKACTKLNSWRLEQCELYVTIEPCAMCAGAILQSRIPNVIFGASNPKAGCVGSITNLLTNNKFNHQCEIVSGIMANEIGNMMSNFFINLRQRKGE